MSHNITISTQQLPEAQENMEFLDSSFFVSSSPDRSLPTPGEVRALLVGSRTKPHPVIFEHLGLLVKWGRYVTIAEAQCLHIIKKTLGDAVPVPEVYGWKVNYCEDRSEVFIYMQYIQGQPLRDRWVDLSVTEKTDICSQLRKIITALRQVSQPSDDQFIGKL
jgi:hypothetical protein